MGDLIYRFAVDLRKLTILEIITRLAFGSCPSSLTMDCQFAIPDGGRKLVRASGDGKLQELSRGTKLNWLVTAGTTITGTI